MDKPTKRKSDFLHILLECEFPTATVPTPTPACQLSVGRVNIGTGRTALTPRTDAVKRQRRVFLGIVRRTAIASCFSRLHDPVKEAGKSGNGGPRCADRLEKAPLSQL
ncbi:hypothetical protein EYF80_045910 [Liparis tanakae]|uniref:Uncharacterized protein n=1 Tax=Liparis tanakae TaxID=230148 RepID=A0A4Z2FRW0_9TELE|nr:hypothetical protein EYF80_045910 [Liparis tanakae]